MTDAAPSFTAPDDALAQLARIGAQVRLDPLDTTPWTRACQGLGCREQAKRQRMPPGSELPYLFECPMGHAILSEATIEY